MSRIEIEWLSDWSDCDQCGGNYADGARVTVDGKVALELIPHAHCYDGDHWDERQVYLRLLEHLGHTVTDAPDNSEVGRLIAQATEDGDPA